MYAVSLVKRMSPFSSSICQEVSSGNLSVLSSSSNLNSPTPQEQSGKTVGAEDGEMEGREEAEGEIEGCDEDVGLDVMDGTADGAADRL